MKDKQYMIEYQDFKTLADLARKNYNRTDLQELNKIFSKLKIIIDRSGFDRLTELITPTLDEPDKIKLDIISVKYSVNKLINAYKTKLWTEVKKYQQGTLANKNAHFEYVMFSEYIKKINDDIEGGGITHDMLIGIIDDKLYLSSPSGV
jgi:hypothetical protein